ncbi:MAG: hypothetical protein LBE18_03475 [Planctomycetaceae bacterium]|nr:hypothetical protein [Planctomycetaceae bacterium]
MTLYISTLPDIVMRNDSNRFFEQLELKLAKRSYAFITKIKSFLGRKLRSWSD